MNATMELRGELDPIGSRAAPAGVRLERVGPVLWRAVDTRGRIFGHVEARDDREGRRYRARRFRASARAFLDAGEFWNLEDAVSALRMG